MSTVKVPKKKCIENLSEDDQYLFARILFDGKFLNEYYRIRSIDLIPELVQHRMKLVSKGFYVAGKRKSLTKKYDIVTLGCVFCNFKHELKLTSNYTLNLEKIEQGHDLVRTQNCKLQFPGVRMIRKLKQYNINVTTGRFFPFQAIKSDRQSPYSREQLISREIRAILCPNCKLRPVECMFFPCNHISLCGECVKLVPHEFCIVCDERVLAYMKIFLN